MCTCIMWNLKENLAYFLRQRENKICNLILIYPLKNSTIYRTKSKIGIGTKLCMHVVFTIFFKVQSKNIFSWWFSDFFFKHPPSHKFWSLISRKSGQWKFTFVMQHIALNVLNLYPKFHEILWMFRKDRRKFIFSLIETGSHETRNSEVICQKNILSVILKCFWNLLRFS